MKDIRAYWQNPSLTSELSKEQREEVAELFLKLKAKNEKENAEWRSKVMKERNKNLPKSCGAGPTS